MERGKTRPEDPVNRGWPRFSAHSITSTGPKARSMGASAAGTS